MDVLLAQFERLLPRRVALSAGRGIARVLRETLLEQRRGVVLIGSGNVGIQGSRQILRLHRKRRKGTNDVLAEPLERGVVRRLSACRRDRRKV
eukprot:CAMPEP_0183722790 /NCGR_PEP_ID=MMETSP0737-20130205/14648_1 /TAXON_ID=385413 /ORGANISM="Thalassiosira miniscula, Strain CCMP1093" /LENGTH=92 /DNA_ID=CAMNT_0025953027 /DNA_START=74 /DNA_END=349 /DNA_ORIENTATION=+